MKEKFDGNPPPRRGPSDEDLALAPPAELGTILFSMVEPHPGHAAEFARWYERDHFFSGCMAGANFFSGRRFVATKDLKGRRVGDGVSPETGIDRGSFLNLYWIMKGRRDPALSWSVDQVRRLARQGRMGPPTDSISTGFYEFSGRAADQPEGIPAELALEYPYKSASVLLLERSEETTEEAFRAAVSARIAPTLSFPRSQALWFRPLQLPANAPRIAVPVPRGELECGWLVLLFSDCAPDAPAWDDIFADLDQALKASRLGHLRLGGCFRPILPGVDDYTDNL